MPHHEEHDTCIKTVTKTQEDPLRLTFVFCLSFVFCFEIMSGCRVETKTVVVNNFLKRPWVPDTKERGGLTFLKVDKWDRELNMFITGQGLDLSKCGRSNINYRFIEQLQRLRTQACDEAVSEAYAFDDAMAEQGRKRSRKARLVDEDLVAPYLQIEGPTVVRADGQTVDAMPLNVLFGIKNNPLWLHCTAENLEYLRQGVLASRDAGEQGRCWRRETKDVETDDAPVVEPHDLQIEVSSNQDGEAGEVVTACADVE